jgi:hypothetical protein
MSAPIDDDSANDRLKYAPPWARRQPAGNNSAAVPTSSLSEATSPQPRTSEPSDPPRDLDLPPQVLRVAEAPETAPAAPDPTTTWLRAPARPFEGDRAVRELRARLALNPQAVPEPPEFGSSHHRRKSVWRALGLTIFAAAIAFTTVMVLFPEARRIAPARQAFLVSAYFSPSKADRAASPRQSTEKPPRLVIAEKRVAANHEPVPLGVTLIDAPAQGAALVSGLAPGTRLSHGTSISAGTWRVALNELDQAKVIPPDDFVGTMEITVAVLAANAKVTDKNTVHIDWTDAATGGEATGPATARDEMTPSAAPLTRSNLLTLERDEIEVLVKRGRDFIANGDLAAARLVLRRATNGGDAQAALLLGTTFDPATFEKVRVIGAAPDPAEARNWYQRAIELGSVEAENRLASLADGTR